jgi:hypothetical protein
VGPTIPAPKRVPAKRGVNGKGILSTGFTRGTNIGACPDSRGASAPEALPRLSSFSEFQRCVRSPRRIMSACPFEAWWTTTFIFRRDRHRGRPATALSFRRTARTWTAMGTTTSRFPSISTADFASSARSIAEPTSRERTIVRPQAQSTQTAGLPLSGQPSRRLAIADLEKRVLERCPSRFRAVATAPASIRRRLL